MKSKKKIIRVNLMAVIIAIAIITMSIIGIIKALQHEETEVAKINEYATDYIEAHDISEVFYDNGWVKEYISNIKEEIPIPTGYEYVQGEKNTGFVIKDKNNNYYMWIPYNENAEIKNIDKYYKNVTNNGDIDYNNYESIKRYNGFYISLTKEKMNYNELKDIDNKSYNKLKEEVSKSNNDDEVTNVGLISKFELEQILYFTQNNNLTSVKISNNNNSSYKITKLANEDNSLEEVNTLEPKLMAVRVGIWTGNKEKNVYGYTKWTYEDSQGKTRTVFVPDRFEITIERDRYVRIKSSDNHNLQFVWVSVEDYMDENSNETAAEQIRKELLKLFSQSGTDVKYPLEDKNVKLNDDTEYSIKKFKGFYMAATATKILEDGTISTTEDATKNYKPADGDYIRMTSNYNMQSWYLYINDFVNKEELLENENVNLTVVPTSGYEALFNTIGNDGNSEMLYKDASQENAGTMGNNPSTVELGKEPTNAGVTGIFGRVSETSGNQDEQGNITYNTNGKGERTADMTAMNYTTSTDIPTMSTTTMDEVPEGDAKKGESGKIGFRLAMFISDINRHAQYFTWKYPEVIELKNDVEVPEELIIPAQVEDEDKNVHKVSVVYCTGNKTIKKVIDKVTKGVSKKGYMDCTNLEKVEINYGNIDNEGFANCAKLSEIKLLKDIDRYDAKNSQMIIGRNAFLNCESLKNFVAGEVKERKCEITTMPDKLVYFEGEDLDLSGGILTVTSLNGVTENIDLSIDNSNLKIEGWNDENVKKYIDGISYKEIILTLTYEEMSTTLKVYIVTGWERECEDINFSWETSKNYKLNYELNGRFSCEGIVAICSYVKSGSKFIKKTIYLGNETKKIKKEVSYNKGETWFETKCDNEEGEFWRKFLKVTGYNKMEKGKQNVTLSFGKENYRVNTSITISAIVDQSQTHNEMLNGEINKNDTEFTIIEVKDKDVGLKYDTLQNYTKIYADAFEGCSNIEQIVIGDAEEFKILYENDDTGELLENYDTGELLENYDTGELSDKEMTLKFAKNMIEKTHSSKSVILKIGDKTYKQTTEQVVNLNEDRDDNTEISGEQQEDGQQNPQETEGGLPQEGGQNPQGAEGGPPQEGGQNPQGAEGGPPQNGEQRQDGREPPM